MWSCMLSMLKGRAVTSLLDFPTTEDAAFKDNIVNIGRKCDCHTSCYTLHADEVQEMRAAMSSAAAASGVILFLLSLPVVQGKNGWSVSYTAAQICGLKGSTETIDCSFNYPSSGNRHTTTVKKKVWFVKGNDYDPDDLETDSAYAGRVTYGSPEKSCSLTIRDLRESDSAVYKFRFETDQERGSYTGLRGVTLSVTALQVHVETSPYSNWVVLTCQTSCQLRNSPSFIWYKNGQIMYRQTNRYLYQKIPNSSDSFSCAASGHEALPSPSVCVQGDSCNRVDYSNRSICALKGSSVDISCTYNSYDQQIQSKSWFYLERGYMRASKNPREVSQYEGRVEVTDTERGRSTLRIRDLRESDSAKYHFTFKTQSFEWRSSLHGTTLTVTDVQVHVTGRRLDCVTRCNPSVSSYVWYINGEQVDGANSSSYEIVNLNSYDYKNSYSCALKGFEDFHSPLICYNNHWCNKVTYIKRSICALKGSSVEISCTYSNFERPIKSKFWFLSGRGSEDLRTDSQYEGRVKVTETMVGGSTLRIRDLRESDSAEYHFKFKTQSFEWKNGIPGTTLTVTDVEVQVTGRRLACVTRCNPYVSSYVWFINREVVNGASSSFYEISNENSYHYENIYSCALKGFEDFHSPFIYAPNVVSAVANYSGEIMEGSSVTLNCSSEANPAANYTWYKEQTLLSKQQQVFIKSMNSSDSGNYHCIAENELGKSLSDHIFINVKYAPKLPSVSVSPSAGMVEGSSVTLTCRSDANPAANYTWYKENKLLFYGPVGEYNFSVHSEDRVNYFCKAENQHGQANSSSLFVDVQYAPKLPSVSVSPSAEIVEGSSLTLTCSSDANPAANYTWYKKDEETPKAAGENFTITDVRPEHSGSYYCVALNTRGRHNSTLRSINVPGSVNSAAVGSITVLFLTLLIISAIIVIRKRTFLTQFFSRERPNSKVQQSVRPKYDDPSAAAQSIAAEQQDDLCYASVSFSKIKDDPVYSNITPTKHSRQSDEDEEEAEYTLVKFSNGTQGLRGQQAVEDSSALYSTVNKIY